PRTGIASRPSDRARRKGQPLPPRLSGGDCHRTGRPVDVYRPLHRCRGRMVRARPQGGTRADIGFTRQPLIADRRPSVVEAFASGTTSSRGEVKSRMARPTGVIVRLAYRPAIPPTPPTLHPVHPALGAASRE